jgi:hypothetical protein
LRSSPDSRPQPFGTAPSEQSAGETTVQAKTAKAEIPEDTADRRKTSYSTSFVMAKTLRFDILDDLQHQTGNGDTFSER